MTIDEMIEEEKKMLQPCNKHCQDKNNITCESCRTNHKAIIEWLTRLKKNRQLKEQGMLIKLPCKVGDTVYVVDNCIQIKPAECRIGLIGYTATLEDKGFNFVAEFEKDSSIIEEFEDKDIGKTVFLTKSEAEAKLKELRGIEHGNKRIKDNT